MFVAAVCEWQFAYDSIDLFDLKFRLERRFRIRITIASLSTMASRNDPPDIRVGDLFDLVRTAVPQSGVLDSDLDADALWPMFQREISDAMGVAP
jgi:hypothetical protein